MRIRAFTVVVAGCFALAACGHNQGDRAVTGATLGAGAALAIVAVAGAPLLGATVIGAGAGAVAGAVTDPHKIDLDRPFWER